MYTKRMLRELTYQIEKMFYRKGDIHITRQFSLKNSRLAGTLRLAYTTIERICFKNVGMVKLEINSLYF
jgi:hypothetical protein